MNIVSREPISVVVVGHPLVRVGLQMMYAASAATRVVGEGQVEDLPDLLDLLPEVPDVVVMVSASAGDPVAERLVAVRERHAELPVMVLLQSVLPEVALAVIQAGATGCFVLDADERDLVNATVAATRGGSPIDARLARFVIDNAMNGGRRTELLTAREGEVLELVWNGMSNKQIARELGITEPTVKAYLTRIYQRLGVRSRTEAAMWEEARRRSGRSTVLAS